MRNKLIFALVLICANAFSAVPNMSLTINPVTSAFGYLNGSFKYRVAEKVAIGVHGEKTLYSPFKDQFLWQGYADLL